MSQVAEMGVRLPLVLRGGGRSTSAALLGYEDLPLKANFCSPVSFSRAGASAAAPAAPMLLPGRRAVLVGGRSDGSMQRVEGHVRARPTLLTVCEYECDIIRICLY